jgi:hypothetical protein
MEVDGYLRAGDYVQVRLAGNKYIGEPPGVRKEIGRVTHVYGVWQQMTVDVLLPGNKRPTVFLCDAVERCCRSCCRPKNEHDEHTNKCLFGAGKWM